MAQRRRLRMAAACGAGLAVPAAAGATTFVETEEYYWNAVDRFGNSFDERTLLPAGTTAVTGHLYYDEILYDETGEFDWADYVVFGDLVPGSAFTLTFDLSSDAPTAPRILNDRDELLQPVRDIGYKPGPWTFTGAVPASGALVLGMTLGQDRTTYQLALDAPRVPEPGTAALAGAGLAAAASCAGARGAERRAVHVLPALVSEADAAAVRAEIASGAWADGRRTAAALARRVKRNEELHEAGAALSPAQRRVADDLGACELLQSVALPRRTSPPMFSRYRPGMAYGRHVDNALLSATPPLRADLAITLFLSDRKDYDGGELVVATPAGEADVKLPSGSRRGVRGDDAPLGRARAPRRAARGRRVGAELRARRGDPRAAPRSRRGAGAPARGGARVGRGGARRQEPREPAAPLRRALSAPRAYASGASLAISSRFGSRQSQVHRPAPKATSTPRASGCWSAKSAVLPMTSTIAAIASSLARNGIARCARQSRISGPKTRLPSSAR
ncbi:MAG: hypothetical protein DCC71_21185 [Proteobacteria bacterium]|nr:MAG: hypothetical protein DCC71_21185 [Pseudomonadota bacterium]